VRKAPDLLSYGKIPTPFDKFRRVSRCCDANAEATTNRYASVAYPWVGCQSRTIRSVPSTTPGGTFRDGCRSGRFRPAASPRLSILVVRPEQTVDIKSYTIRFLEFSKRGDKEMCVFPATFALFIRYVTRQPTLAGFLPHRLANCVPRL